MKITDIFKLSLNGLTHRGLRSWLTILGIIVGVAAVVAMLSISEGMSKNVESQMSDLGADIITISPGYSQAERSGGGIERMREEMGPMMIPGGPWGGMQQDSEEEDSPTLTDDDIYVLYSVDDIVAVSGVISDNRVEAKYLSESVSVSVEGVDPTTWIEVSNPELDSGRFLEDDDLTNVVVGYSVANEMFEEPLTVNTRIKIEGKYFEIVGILKQSGTGGFGGDDRTVFMTYTALSNIVDDVELGEYSSIEVKVSDTDKVDEIIENIESVLYSSHDVTEDTKDFTVSSPTSMLETLTSTMETLSFFLIGIAAISLLVGAIGISNTMFMSVMERTRLIGIFKSLGTRNSEIMKLFLTESAVIGFMGGVLGVFAGFILVGFISSAGLNLMGMGPRVMSTNTSVAIVTPELIIFALLFSTVIGIISGLIPARKAAKLQIVEAMRSE